MPVKSYNLTIYPNAHIRKQACEVSRSITQQHDTYFTLDDATFFPHVTLRAFDLEESDLERAIAIIQETIESTVPFELVFDRYADYQDTWIGADHKRNSAIDKLHTSLVHSLNDIRIKTRTREDLEERTDLSEADKVRILTYGYSQMLDTYSPHLTLTRLPSGASSVLSELPDLNWTFTADTFILFESAEHGTCTKQVAFFSTENTP